jgi:hypothetical protein
VGAGAEGAEGGMTSPEQFVAMVAEASAKASREAVRDELEAFCEQLQGDERIPAREASRRYGRTARWWREHADEFGAERDGNGPRPRIMFSVQRIERARQTRRPG